MIKINSRGKEISKLEAETLIQNLKTELISPNLNEQERAGYELIKKAIKSLEYLNPNAKIKELSEKEYLIGELNSKIKIAEFAEKREYCEQHGHIPNNEYVGSGQGGTKVYGECKRCGMDYDRPLNSKEWENFHKMMNLPITI